MRLPEPRQKHNFQTVLELERRVFARCGHCGARCYHRMQMDGTGLLWFSECLNPWCHRVVHFYQSVTHYLADDEQEKALRMNEAIRGIKRLMERH